MFACGSRLLRGWRRNGRDLLCSLSHASGRSVRCTDYLKLKETGHITALYYSAIFELSSQSNYYTGVSMTEERQIQAYTDLFLTCHKSTSTSGIPLPKASAKYFKLLSVRKLFRQKFTSRGFNLPNDKRMLMLRPRYPRAVHLIHFFRTQVNYILRSLFQCEGYFLFMQFL